VAAKCEPLVSGKRKTESHQPAGQVGHQRKPAGSAHKGNDNRPVHECRGASNGDEPRDVAVLTMVEQLAHRAMKHSGRRAICIAADDFGLHAGINHAVLRLADQRVVNAIGCMVGAEAWREGSRALQRLEPKRVDIGLHLDLTESPLLPRTLRPLKRLIVDSFLRRLDRGCLHAEISAQLGAFEQAIGRAPAYVDGHQHVHQLPVVREALLCELGERYPGPKPWLRSTRADTSWRQCLRFKPWLVERLGAAGLASMATRAGCLQNRRLLGVYDFYGGSQRYAQLLTAWLLAARDGDLLLCHPSLPMPSGEALIAARIAEFRVLSDPTFVQQLADAGIALEPMSRILGVGAAAPG
jgi:chitin disaccharide deacetylase